MFRKRQDYYYDYGAYGDDTANNNDDDDDWFNDDFFSMDGDNKTSASTQAPAKVSLLLNYKLFIFWLFRILMLL